MGLILIKGGRQLSGEVSIQGSKNAVLPIMAACVLVPGVTILKNCPDISDVACMCELLKHVGAGVSRQGDEITIDTSRLLQHRLPGNYVERMRSSIVLAGAMLGRCGEIEMAYPGGCVIGDRPIDLHIYALKRLGAAFWEDGDRLCARTDRLQGTRIAFPFPSVGATQNAVMAAVLAKGTTELYGCAMEPEVRALCDFLNRAGARIHGGGSRHIVVEGVTALHPCEYRVEADRIVAGTYLIGVLAAGGSACLRHAPAAQLAWLCDIARRMGAELQTDAEGIRVKRLRRLYSPGHLETGAYPAFPTDLQSPLLVALCQAEGKSSLTEQIFNGRLAVAGELNRMGAAIEVKDNCAFLRGNASLTGCDVTAGELRGGAALVLAGVCARGETRVHNRQFIDRGYEDIVRDLKELGADIGGEK